MKKNGITIQEIYELVDRKINEVNTSITRLEVKFDTLEAGRLSSLEKEFARLQGKMAIIAGVISILVSILGIILNKFL